MAVAITLSNGRTWRMKAAALSHFKATLARYADGNVAEDRDDHVTRRGLSYSTERLGNDIEEVARH